MFRMRSIVLLLMLAAAGARALPAQEEGAAVETEVRNVPAEAASDLFQQRAPRYQLRPGDVLEISFAFTPEFNQTIAVQPDGFVTLRDAGDIHVAGLDVPGMAAAVRKAYEAILRNAQVTITLKEFEKPYFLASGFLRNPGKFDLRGETTAAQAVAMAGGFSPGAKHSEVLIFRRLSRERMEVKKVDLKKMLAKHDASEDLYLRPGDLLFVPQSKISKLKEFVTPRVALGLRPF